MLAITVYKAVFTSEAPIVTSNPPGVLWHSIFGKALHDVVCTQTNTDCSNCHLQHGCDYTALFNTLVPEDAHIMRNYTHVPAPHAFLGAKCENETTPATDTGNPYDVEITFSLAGHSNDRLPSVVAALAQAGYNGIGKSRTKANLCKLYRIASDGGNVELSLSKTDSQPNLLDIPEHQGAAEIEFLSPYIPPGKRKPEPRQFDLSALLMGIVRRIDLLNIFYSNTALDIDFKAIKAITLKTDCAQPQLRKTHATRYSAGHSKEINISGLTGRIRIDSTIAEPLWQFLYAGSFVNVGKNASMGMGQYRLRSL